MKRMIAMLSILLLLLSGCGDGENTMDQALWLRSQLSNAGCSFEAVITADYGDVLYTFKLDCRSAQNGDLVFCVLEPETIAGIRGKVEASGGKLTFDDVAIALPLLADDQLAPIAAPWALVRTLRGGYIDSTGADGEYTRLTIHDSYAEDALTVDIWLNAENMPVHAEIEWEDRRILSMEIKNFAVG